MVEKFFGGKMDRKCIIFLEIICIGAVMKIINLHFLTFIIVYIVILGISYIIYRRKKKKFHTFLYWTLVEFYCLLFVKVTILPICVWNSGTSEQIKKAFSRTGMVIQYIPFARIEQYFYSRWGMVQLVGNIILLMPIVVIMMWFSKKRYSNKYIILSILGISVGIEGIQYMINCITSCPSHVTDINDIIFNVAGGILCLFICKRIEKKFQIVPDMFCRKFLI